MGRSIQSGGGPVASAWATAAMRSLFSPSGVDLSASVAEAKAKPPVGFVIRNGATVVPTRIGRRS